MKHDELQEEIERDYKWCKDTFSIKDPIDVVNGYIAEYTTNYLNEESISIANWNMKMMKKWVAIRQLLINDAVKKATSNG